VRRREPLDDDAAGGPFDRSPATWRRLSAPPDLYDVAAAAEAYRSYSPPGWRLDGPESSPGGPACQLMARRHWRWARAQFLTQIGALTAEERALLQRWPQLHALPTWSTPRVGADRWR
jgi:hypothetical protein